MLVHGKRVVLKNIYNDCLHGLHDLFLPVFINAINNLATGNNAFQNIYMYLIKVVRF
jgi:hypothetical protein